MKKTTISILILFVFSISLFSATQKEIKLNSSGKDEFKVLSKSETGFRIFSSISTLFTTEVITDQGLFIDLGVNNYTKNFRNAGSPHLPVLTDLVEVPYGANIKINILNYEEEIIDLNTLGITSKLHPAQPSISKGLSPEEIIFYYDQVSYQIDDFNNDEIVTIDIKGKMRGVQFGRITISPMQYNPVKNIIKVYNNIEFEVIFENADVLLSKQMKQRYYSPMFESVYSQFLNYMPTGTKDQITTYPITYIIVADRSFELPLQSFIDWKVKKGFKVIEAYTDVIGTTTTAIQSYLNNLYQTEVPTPTFVLFVGDITQIPSFNGTAGTHVSDAYYCCFDGGTDFIPELYYGRFSAETTNELQTIINKVLMHEQYTWPNDNFLDECVLIAGVDGSMAPSHGNGQIYYGLDQYFNTSNGYSSIYAYLYGSSTHPSQIMDSNAGGASASIISDISGGVGFANYTAHCNWDGWSDPSFSNTDIPSLTNTGEYPFMIGNCCLSNKFNENSPDCFGEQIVYAPEKGAVGYIGGSNNTLWDEDFYWAVGLNTLSISSANSQLHTYANTGPGVYDGIWHINGEPETEWFITAGEMLYTGNLAVESSTSTENVYYWEIYHLMGDPSMMAYLSKPSAMTISYIDPITVGLSSLVVNTEPYSYVALSHNGVLLDAQYAGTNSSVTLNFTAFTAPTTADIVVTKQNRQPYIGTLNVISGNTNDDAGVTNVGNPLTNYDCPQTVQPEFTIMNMGANNLTSLTVGYILDGGTPVTQAWSGNLAQYSSDVVTFPSISLAQGNHVFEAFSVNPNGNTDEYSPNDTLITSFNVSNNITQAAFVADEQLFCNPPVDVNFTNNSDFASSYYWDFGDGTTSNLENPTHTYTTSGSFTVSLIAENGICGADTIVETGFVSIDPGNPCDYIMPNTGTVTQTACGGTIYDSGGENGDYSSNENGIYVISPASAASVTLDFIYMDIESNTWWGGCYDELRIYDGPSISSTEIGRYCNDNPPTTITSTGGSITLNFISDGNIQKGGFEIEWSCLALDVESIDYKDNVLVFPNPVTDIVQIDMGTESYKVIEIYNITGELVDLIDVDEKIEEYDMNEQPSGVYYFRLLGDKKTITKRVVKQ